MRACALAVLVVLSASGPAYAQSRQAQKQKFDEAMPHFQRGVELYDERDFMSALIEFRRAYQIAQNYHVLFNVAQTCYELQNYACSLDAFQKYLTDGSTTLPRERRAYVDKEISKLKARVAQVRVTVNVPGADVSVDDEKVGTSPLFHSLTISQGKRKITASIEGKLPVTKTIEIAGGDSTLVSLEIQNETPPPPPPVVAPPAPIETRRHVPWGVWATAGGLLLAWGATGGLALAFSGDAQTKLNTYGASASDIKTAQDDARGFALASDITLGCTAVAVLVATIMTLVAKPEPVEKRRARLFVSPTGTAVLGVF